MTAREQDVQRAVFQHIAQRGVPNLFAFHPASVHAMRRLLASVGLSLHDLADAIEVPARASQHDDDPDWRVMAKACAQCPHLLSERERSFVTTMSRWRGKPSRKQAEWLEAIHDRISEAAA